MIATKRSSKSTSIPAPVGGWNARDSIANMPVTDAAIMTNWFPTTTDVMVRKGYSNFATGLVNQVESLMVYAGGAANKMFAAAGTGFFNITAGGAVGAAVQTGLANARWDYQNISTVGGNFMLCTNGFDKLRGYDGTNWWRDGDGTHDITGFDTSTAYNSLLFKNRMWFTQKNTLNLYYLGTSSIAGAASLFPLGSVAREGGYIVDIGAWTLDAGYGVDDYLVAITNKGEVLVYRGTDPSSASTWSLVGVWKIGAPVGIRPMFKYGGDLLVITQDGLTPLSSALQSDRLNPRVSLTDKIQWAISTSISNYGGTFGWQTVYYPKNNMLLLNVPIAVGSQEQYAMNNITKNWSRFTNWNANCWALYNDDLYFGSNGVVCKAWDTNADNGADIVTECAQAFSYFGTPGRTKRFMMVRPLISSNGSPKVLAQINTDFQYSNRYNPLTANASAFSLWGTAKWGQGTWGTSNNVTKVWNGATSLGYSAGCELEVATNGIETRWVSTDYVYEVGGVL
jgi:hypothetical protein